MHRHLPSLITMGPVTLRSPACSGGPSNPIVSAVIFWIGFFVVSALAFSVVRAVDETRIPVWELIVLFAIGAALLAFHAFQRGRRVKTGPSWLRRRESGLLLIAIVLFLGGALFAFIAIENSRELSIRQRMVAQTISGTVVAVGTPDGGFVADDYAVDVVIPDVLPPYEEDGEVLLYEDLEGEAIEPCSAPSSSEVCLTFTTNTEFAENKRVDVRFDPDEGIAFFQEDRWSLPGLGALYPVVAVWLFVLCFESVRALWWRRDNKGLAVLDERSTTAAVSLPPPPDPSALPPPPGRPVPPSLPPPPPPPNA
jgi:hypothetical protein